MIAKQGMFFESKVRLEKVTEDCMQVKFVELYVVDAMTFTECEAKVNEYVSQYASGEFEVLTECKAAYGEILFSEKEDESLFFKIKVDFITIDEKSGKEKHSKSVYLVQGDNVETAKRNLDAVFSGSMIDYKVVAVSETTIADFIGSV